jgi:hypothetical protein
VQPELRSDKKDYRDPMVIIGAKSGFCQTSAFRCAGPQGRPASTIMPDYRRARHALLLQACRR